MDLKVQCESVIVQIQSELMMFLQIHDAPDEFSKNLSVIIRAGVYAFQFQVGIFDVRDVIDHFCRRILT